MKYILLIYENEQNLKHMPAPAMEAMLGEYRALSESITKSGHFLGGGQLHPTDRATSLRFRDGRLSTVDGPFAETKELIAGFWLIQVQSKEEAIEWVKRCPNPFAGESEIELRQVFEADDFGPEFTPELRAQEDRLRAQAAENAQQ